MSSYRDKTRNEMLQAQHRYRNAGFQAPIVKRANGQEMLAYQAPGAIVAGQVDALSLNFATMTQEDMPVVTWATTTERVIRSNERMDVSGIKLRAYVQNSVILWSHKADLPPIGHGLSPRQSVVNSEKAILLDIRFNCIGQLAQDTCKLTMLGDIAAGSHGFIPLASKIEPRSSYPESYPQFPNVVTYTEWEMLEFSLCTIPMNPAALRQHGSTTMIDPEFEARLRSRIDAGLIDHEGDGIVHALLLATGGNRINLGQTAAIPTGTEPEPITLPAQPEPDMPENVTHEYHNPWDFGAIYAMVPEPFTADIARFTGAIKPEDLDAKGVEPKIIIPLLCDVKTMKADVVTAALEGAEEFDVTFGAVSVDTGDEWRNCDRMYLDIASPGGANVSEQLSGQLKGWTDQLRIHLATLKMGNGADYAGSDQLSGKTFTVSELVFRDVSGTETTIPLAATTKTHIARVRSITMPAKTHDMPVTDPNMPVTTPVLPIDPDAAADAKEAGDLKALKGLDFDLAFLAEIKEDAKEWMDMAAIAATNSNRQDVKDIADSITTAAQTTLDAVNQILTDLGVDMSGEQPAPGASPDGTVPAEQVSASWYKAMAFVAYRKHVGAAFNQTHKGYIKQAHEACAALHTAAFGSEPAKTGTASVDMAGFVSIQQYETDIKQLVSDLAIVKAHVAPTNPEPEVVNHSADNPVTEPEPEIVDLSKYLEPAV